MQPTPRSAPNTLSLAREIHARFRALPGSEQIASEFAIAGLIGWLRRTRPYRVLEVGAGIGALTATIAQAGKPPAVFVSTEPDAWCRLQCVANTGYWPVPPVDIINLVAWEMVVLDGDLDVTRLQFARRAVIFVEGGRRHQRAILDAELRRQRRAFAHAHWKPLDRSKGFHVYALDPKWAMCARFALVRAREAMLDLAARVMGYPIGKRRARPRESATGRERAETDERTKDHERSQGSGECQQK